MLIVTRQIVDGDLPRSPLLGVFCGRTTPTDVVQSSGNVMVVHFTSLRGYVAGRGFSASYTSNEPSGLSHTQCDYSTVDRYSVLLCRRISPGISPGAAAPLGHRLYTVSGKKRPPKENAVKCTAYNTIQ